MILRDIGDADLRYDLQVTAFAALACPFQSIGSGESILQVRLPDLGGREIEAVAQKYSLEV